VCSVASARRLKPLAEVIILRFRLQALKKTERTAITSKAIDERAALPLANNQQAQNAEWPLSVTYAKDAKLDHQECCPTGSGNKQTELTVATSTTVCSGTTRARGSPAVPEVSACRRPETLSCVLSNLQCWLWWQAATLAESPPSAPSVTPLLTRKSAGDVCVTASTVPASAPVDTGGGYGRGRKAVHVSAARSKGNESRVGVPPLCFAHAIGRTSSPGGNCCRVIDDFCI
jgi:hypothetical protein